jgi:Cu(I)-responsive transcriptional regulator
MNIGETARASGVAAKTIRYYEEIGLVRAAKRAPNGYRRYDEHDVQRLRFVQRARSLGFSIDDVRSLLALWGNRRRASADVKRLAMRHVAEVDRRVAELQGMRATLMHLVERCHGDDRPHCPILDELAGAGEKATSQPPDRAGNNGKKGRKP